MAGGVTVSTILHGGKGNDQINGGNGNNIELGEEGDDKLIGGINRDILIGGTGADQLVGNGGDDILIGGTTDHEQSNAALCAIMDQWAGSVTAAERATALTPLLNADRVYDDEAVDVFSGGAGDDWIFFNPDQDRVNGKAELFTHTKKQRT